MTPTGHLRREEWLLRATAGLWQRQQERNARRRLEREKRARRLPVWVINPIFERRERVEGLGA
jgi:hypothetical protein